MITTEDIVYLSKKQIYTKNRVSSSRFKKNKMTEITKSKDGLSKLFLVTQILEENPHCCSTGCKWQHFSYCKSYQQNTGGMQHEENIWAYMTCTGSNFFLFWQWHGTTSALMEVEQNWRTGMHHEKIFEYRLYLANT